MRGATILKASDDKTRQLNKHTLMAFSGEAGDTGESVHHRHHHLFITFIISHHFLTTYPPPSVQSNLQSTSKQTPNSTACATTQT